MSVPVNRSLSPFLESGTPETDYGRRFRLASGHKSLSWSDLLERRMVVILGKAGMGKTFWNGWQPAGSNHMLLEPIRSS